MDTRPMDRRGCQTDTAKVTIQTDCKATYKPTIYCRKTSSHGGVEVWMPYYQLPGKGGGAIPSALRYHAVWCEWGQIRLMNIEGLDVSPLIGRGGKLS
eukprot:32556-Eustigmatos_ZCMA.PRE.1